MDIGHGVHGLCRLELVGNMVVHGAVESHNLTVAGVAKEVE